jgi:hypothetical protein
LKSEGATPALAPRHAAIAAPTSTPAPLPGPLRSGAEALGGFSLADVRVHRDSPEPAKLGALAFARGSDIHLGPGQERHLPHEAWHVVQQKQGRVNPTTQLKGIPVDQGSSLEAEADHFGARFSSPTALFPRARESAVRSGAGQAGAADVIQLKMGNEGQDPTLSDLTSLNKDINKTFTTYAGALTMTLGLEGKVEHKTVAAVVEALTEPQIKKGKTAIGMEVGTQLGEIAAILRGEWSVPPMASLIHPRTPSPFISTDVGRFNVKTSMSLIPFSVTSEIKPQDVEIDLGGGHVAVLSITYSISAEPTQEPPEAQDSIDWNRVLYNVGQAVLKVIYAIVTLIALVLIFIGLSLA